MAFGGDCLVNKINSKILDNTLASSFDFSQISGSYSALNNSFLRVGSLQQLPLACDNEGRFVYIEDIKSFRYSDGFDWIKETRSTLGQNTGLFSWGYNNAGQLGDGTTVSRSSPGTVAGGGTTWCQSSGSWRTAAAVKTDGTLWVWGCNGLGQLGDGTTLQRFSPGTVVGGGTTWCQVFTGRFHSAAIKTDGTLWTWGENVCGKLGDGTAVNRCSPGEIKSDWNTISSGYRVMGAIKCDGTLWTWGNNFYGVLGDGTEVDRCSPGTVAGGGTTWCQISIVFRKGASAIKTDGTLWTWGQAYGGFLGDGTTLKRCSPGTVAGGGTTWCNVFTGCYVSAAIKTDGTLWTWGKNQFGGLGDGTTVSRCSPGTVAGGGTTWSRVAGGRYHVLGLKTDGTLWSWGKNDNGVLGDGTITLKCSPGTIWGGGTTWCQIGCGHYHSVAIKTDGTLWTWGKNNVWQLGNGTTVARCSPGTVAGGGNIWCRVDGGFFHTSAIKLDGTLWSWGSGGDGATSLDLCSPGSVNGGGTNWLRISSGFEIGGGIKTNGTLWTWGTASFGALGSGASGPQAGRDSPGKVAEPVWCQVSGERYHTAAIKTDGTLWTWGCNAQGLLGTGTTVNRCSPGTVAGGGTTWCQIGGLYRSNVAIKTDGTLWTWGCNTTGQLGTGTTVSRCSPGTTAGSGTTWCKVFVGGPFATSAAVKTDGTLWTWGGNVLGELGDGTQTSRCSPGTVAGGGTTWCQVAVTNDNIAAIKTDGTLWTWGSNNNGQLGDGAGVFASRCSPGTIAGGGTTWSQVSTTGYGLMAIRTRGF